MVTEKELNEIFQRIGNEMEFKDVSAEYAPFRDLKIKWTRTFDWARFTVSDYLKDAPEEVIEDLAETVMRRIHGMDPVEYKEDTMEWLTSDEFLELNQETYIERSRSVDIDTDDDRKLIEAYDGLVEAGLVGRIPGLRMFWSKGENVAKAGQSSCLMRTVIMNKRLKDEKVPPEVLDYCLLREIANIAVPYGPDNLERKRDINEIAEVYPGADTARRWLDQVMMEV